LTNARSASSEGVAGSLVQAFDALMVSLLG
jgi:hypothetical protein